MLVETSRIIAENLRCYEMLCRVGGEEFAILTLQSGLDESIDIVQRIKQNIKSRMIVLDKHTQISITVSIGVSTYRDGDSIDSMLARADNALYKAKNNGRDCVMPQRAAPAVNS